MANVFSCGFADGLDEVVVVEEKGPFLERLTPETKALVLEITQLPETVRGYEEIKLAGVERFRERAAELREQLGDGGQE